MNEPADWTEPGAYPVADGIHRIPLPLPNDGLKAVNVYVIETSDGLTCVDGGWALTSSRDRLEHSLSSIGYHPRDIRSFLVTHAHRDHYTQAAAIRQEFGNASVTMGAGDRRTLDMVRSGAAQPFSERLLACGAHELAQQWNAQRHTPPNLDHWRDPDAWLEGDQVLSIGSRIVDAVATPGHTAGHFVFADLEAGILFAGDHVLPTITPSVGFQADLQAQPLRDFMTSLAKVRSMPDLRVLPAHGPTTTRSHSRVDELLRHHEERLHLSLTAVEAGHHTAYEVARQLPWTRHHKSLPQLDSFNAGLAVMETMIHLDLLAARREVTRHVEDNVVVYTPVVKPTPTSATGPRTSIPADC